MADKLTATACMLWEAKYRAEGDDDIRRSWQRVAGALAAVEPRDRERWERVFLDAMEAFRFLPGGRILAGAGSGRRVTLLNCFVMGPIVDSIDGIFEALKEGAVTMQQGGGVGYDFSTLRPSGTQALATGTVASGPVSFMRVFDVTCQTMLSTGARRGAMMATLRCDHPDVETFIGAKARAGELANFNQSLLVSDDFVRAVRADEEWPLVFPIPPSERAAGPMVWRRWSAAAEPVACRVHRVVRARELWMRLARAAREHGDPGAVFIDRINRDNNLGWREQISATNPCGEEPLPPYGACDLGSIELSRFVVAPFSPEASLDLDAVARIARIGVRMLDDVLDATAFPLERQRAQASSTRRVGLGITGLADALAMRGVHYASPAARREASTLMRVVRDAAYEESVRIAEEKGAFPAFDRRWLDTPFVRTLPLELRERIGRSGIRNSHLLAIAPTGSISVLAGNVSSGVEPIFALRFRRRLLGRDGVPHTYEVVDRAFAVWQEMHGDAAPPDSLATAARVSAREQLAMQAELQSFVDGAISKTIRLEPDASADAVAHIFEDAYDSGVKGCTVFRPNPVTGVVLAEDQSACGTPACAIEREPD
jgi:ribonucleoside-diphosphate reductase alpha chain